MIRYRTLLSVMALRGCNANSLASATDIGYRALLRKLHGKAEFSFSDCSRIRTYLHYTGSIEKLFERMNDDALPEATDEVQ